MLRFVLIAGMLVATAAAADERIDRSIDEAAGRIVADRVGELRGSLKIGEKPEMVQGMTADAGARRTWTRF